MKLDNCIECIYHNNYINGQVLCNFSNILNSIATYTDEKKAEIIVIGCPIDKT
jgi:hypothetical protein